MIPNPATAATIVGKGGGKVEEEEEESLRKDFWILNCSRKDPKQQERKGKGKEYSLLQK